MKRKAMLGKTERAQWAILIVTAVLAAVSFMYLDILVNTGHAFCLLDSIAAGDPLDFYYRAATTKILDGYCTAHYPITVYAILAVWDLPVWLIGRFTAIDPLNNVFCLVWVKLFSVLFAALSARSVQRIAGSFSHKSENGQRALFYYLTSGLLFTSALMISQFEIVTVTVILLGVECYLRGDKRGFLLWFALAITFKYFALVVFLPLVLLKEKKPGKIVLDILLGCSAALACVAVFWSAPSGEDTMLNPTRLITRILESTVSISIVPVSVPIAIFAAVLIYCYCCPHTRPGKGAWQPLADEQKDWVLYLCAVALCGFFLSWYAYPYWLILIEPFVILCVCRAHVGQKLCLLLETAFGICLALAHFCVFDWCFAFDTMNRMLPGASTGVWFTERSNAFSALLNAINLKDGFGTAATSLTVVCLVALFVVTWPGRKAGQTPAFYDGEDALSTRAIEWVRLAFVAAMVLASIGSYVGRALLG